MDGTNIVWILGVPVATIVLGLAIAYGILRARKRTRGEKLATEAGTRRIYDEAEAESRPR